MPDPTTTNLKLSVPTHGSDVDTWDVPVNGNSTILDNKFGSVTTKALTNTNVTLSVSEAQASIIRLTGTLSSTITLNVGAIQSNWLFDNRTTGNFVVLVSGGSGNVVGLPPGECTQVYWDGGNCGFIGLDRVGGYWDYAGDSVPLWVQACTVPPYLLCDGSSFSSGTYPSLYAILGTTTLPDARGRSRAPLNGGTSRLTSAGGVNGDVRFSAGGNQTVTLDLTQLPTTLGNYTRSAPGFDWNSTTAAGGSSGTIIVFNSSPSLSSQQVQNPSGGSAHSNVQPTYIGGITMIRAA